MRGDLRQEHTGRHPLSPECPKHPSMSEAAVPAPESAGMRTYPVDGALAARHLERPRRDRSRSRMRLPAAPRGRQKPFPQRGKQAVLRLQPRGGRADAGHCPLPPPCVQSSAHARQPRWEQGRHPRAGLGKVPGCPVGAASSPARGNYALRSCCVVGSYQGVIQPPRPGGSVSHLRWPLI